MTSIDEKITRPGLKNMINDKYDIKCSVCKETKSNEYFVRVISRHDYAPGCDDEGYSHFAKPTKICMPCRIKQRYVMQKRNIQKKNKLIN